jgi:predicted DNA-binding protein
MMTTTAMTVKLTIKIPEDLRRQAKAVAALRGETVSDIVRTALEKYIVEALEETDDTRVVREIEARLAAGEERVYSHEEVWAEIEALESQGALPD